MQHYLYNGCLQACYRTQKEGAESREPGHAVGGHLLAVVSQEDVEDVALRAGAERSLVQHTTQVFAIVDHHNYKMC